MKAMILAAGFGTRLGPLTQKRPKALMPVGNRPIIDWIIDYLKEQGVRNIVVNAHHLYDQILNHLCDNSAFGINIEVRVEKEILGTGGGIRNTMDFWNGTPFIVINGDTLTDIDISGAYRAHERRGNMVTLVLHDKAPFNQIEIDNQLNIKDIAHGDLPNRLAFTGIHIIDPKLLEFLPEGVFSNIVECYRDLIKSDNPIRGFLSKGHIWQDIGTVETYLLANKKAAGSARFIFAPNTSIAPSARLEDWAVLGHDVQLEEGAEIRRSVLWEEVRVKKGMKVIDSVVTSRNQVDRHMMSEVL
jgi:NDP-sugar pyrophosphorylase family protein